MEPGARFEHTLEVTPDLAVNFLGLETARVLGTPFLIYNLEIAARNAVLPLLEPGYDTVGTLVNVRHLAATPLGMRVTFQAELIEATEKRVLFHVQAHDEKEQIADGTHERAIIHVARFGARVQAKRA